jgi:hypothetical protein
MSSPLSQARIIHLTRYAGKLTGWFTGIAPYGVQNEVLQRGDKQG